VSLPECGFTPGRQHDYTNAAVCRHCGSISPGPVPQAARGEYESDESYEASEALLNARHNQPTVVTTEEATCPTPPS
jgi:hypothetical protein